MNLKNNKPLLHLLTQAQEDLANAKLELQQYQGVLRDLEAQQAEQRRQEALQEQVAKEQQRLEREAKQNQTLVVSAASAEKQLVSNNYLFLNKKNSQKHKHYHIQNFVRRNK